MSEGFKKKKNKKNHTTKGGSGLDSAPAWRTRRAAADSGSRRFESRLGRLRAGGRYLSFTGSPQRGLGLRGETLLPAKPLSATGLASTGRGMAECGPVCGGGSRSPQAGAGYSGVKAQPSVHRDFRALGFPGAVVVAKVTARAGQRTAGPAVGLRGGRPFCQGGR